MQLLSSLEALQEQLSRLRTIVTEPNFQSSSPEVLGRVSFQIRVWEFTLPITPALPLLLGIDDTVRVIRQLEQLKQLTVFFVFFQTLQGDASRNQS